MKGMDISSESLASYIIQALIKDSRISTMNIRAVLNNTPISVYAIYITIGIRESSICDGVWITLISPLCPTSSIRPPDVDKELSTLQDTLCKYDVVERWIRLNYALSIFQEISKLINHVNTLMRIKYMWRLLLTSF